MREKFSWLKESTKEELVQRLIEIYRDPNNKSTMNRYGNFYLKIEQLEFLADRMLDTSLRPSKNKYQDAYFGKIDAITLRQRIRHIIGDIKYSKKKREQRLQGIVSVQQKPEIKDLRKIVNEQITEKGVVGIIRELREILNELEGEQKNILIRLYGPATVEGKA